MLSTIALFASARRSGNTGQLVDRIADELQIEVVDLAQKSISPFDYEHKNRSDDFEPLMDYVLGFDQIIFSSPVYWYAVAPPMKIFIDRISDLLELPDLLNQGRRLRGKTAYIVCTSIYHETPVPFLDAFRETFGYLGMEYGGCMHANCVDGYAAAEYEEDIKNFINRVRG
ncbi:MAG: NAD(P)H-dependent oxidoreductase [Gammaproteobacteria bacterium]|nr:NAD(P)H-dependent oxidoreductase [Gammaproteobacteria bacterium]